MTWGWSKTCTAPLSHFATSLHTNGRGGQGVHKDALNLPALVTGCCADRLKLPNDRVFNENRCPQLLGLGCRSSQVNDEIVDALRFLGHPVENIQPPVIAEYCVFAGCESFKTQVVQ